jgi:hypothetical protein
MQDVILSVQDLEVEFTLRGRDIARHSGYQPRHL